MAWIWPPLANRDFITVGLFNRRLDLLRRPVSGEERGARTLPDTLDDDVGFVDAILVESGEGGLQHVGFVVDIAARFIMPACGYAIPLVHVPGKDMLSCLLRQQDRTEARRDCGFRYAGFRGSASGSARRCGTVSALIQPVR